MSIRSSSWAKWTTYLLALLALLGREQLAPIAADAADIVYVYDDVGRLVGVLDGIGGSVGYRYDAVGNLTGIVRGGPGGPSITAIAPTSGGVGTLVTITGTAFGTTPADSLVTFNGARAVVTSSTATRIVATVPAGAATGPLTVTTQAGSARSSATFAVTTVDLVPTALTAPATVSPRQKVTTSWTVANRGTGSAKAPWTDVVYLSRDTLCCAGDEPVGGADLTSALGAAQSYSRTSTATLPRLSAGQYYFILSTDDRGTVGETDEGNNRRVLPVTVTVSDLLPTALTAPRAWVRGQTITASFTVKNQGAGVAHADAASNWVDQLHLSTTPTCCDGSTFLIGAPRNAPVNPGAAYSGTRSFVVPNVPPGNYYLVLALDRFDFVGDGDRTNNQRAIPVTVGAPDLVATALSAPASAVTQQPFTVSWTVKNQGSAAVSATWSDRVFLLTRPECCQGEPTLGTVIRPSALAPGASYTVTKTFTLPNVAADTYYVRLSVDDANVVPELDEANNFRSVAIAVTTPDLAAASLVAPSSARAQQSVSLTWTVTNAGTGSAKAPWTDAVYLSTDATCCAGDTALALVSRTAPLAPGASYTQTKSVTIPARPPGNYFLILKTDSTGAVYEAGEANNVRAVPFTIAP